MGEKMPCGHDTADVISSDDGTSYCGKCEAEQEMPEKANLWPTGYDGNLAIHGHWIAGNHINPEQTEYLRSDLALPKDKVREAIKKAIEMDIAQGFWLSTPATYADYDIRKKDYQLKKKQFANIVIFLFPEGLGGEE